MHKHTEQVVGSQTRNTIIHWQSSETGTWILWIDLCLLVNKFRFGKWFKPGFEEFKTTKSVLV